MRTWSLQKSERKLFRLVPEAIRTIEPALGSLKKIISLYAVSFLILATVVVGFIWHDLRAEYRDTLAYWNVQLSSSADERVRVSALWLKERRTDTIAIAESPATIRCSLRGEAKAQWRKSGKRWNGESPILPPSMDSWGAQLEIVIVESWRNRAFGRKWFKASRKLARGSSRRANTASTPSAWNRATFGSTFPLP